MCPPIQNLSKCLSKLGSVFLKTGWGKFDIETYMIVGKIQFLVLCERKGLGFHIVDYMPQ